MSAIMVVSALKEETQGLFEKEKIEVLYTGVGKVNAAYHLSKRLTEKKISRILPKIVVNFGTAGSFSLAMHSIVECNQILQRDMNLSPVGLKPGTTPFDSTPRILNFSKIFAELPAAICGTGDNIQTDSSHLSGVACDVMDMEAYALGKVCHLEKIDFLCIKYVTDGSDKSTLHHWQTNVTQAAMAFLQLYKQLSARF